MVIHGNVSVHYDDFIAAVQHRKDACCHLTRRSLNVYNSVVYMVYSISVLHVHINLILLLTFVQISCLSSVVIQE